MMTSSAVKINALSALLTIPPTAAAAAAAAPSLLPPSPVAILTHGASGDATTGCLPLYASLLAASDVACLRLTCKSSSVAVRAAALREAAAYAERELKAPRIALGGHSMGARAACLAAAAEMKEEKEKGSKEEKRGRLSAVFLSSFPLHAPGKGATGPFRDEALLDLFEENRENEEEGGIKVVVARGSRDAFSSDEPWRELRAKVESLCSTSSPSSKNSFAVFDVEGGDHGLKCSQANGGEAAAAAAIGRAVEAVAEALLLEGGRGGGERKEEGVPKTKKRRRRE